jgi:hypothetical protein
MGLVEYKHRDDLDCDCASHFCAIVFGISGHFPTSPPNRPHSKTLSIALPAQLGQVAGPLGMSIASLYIPQPGSSMRPSGLSEIPFVTIYPCLRGWLVGS